MVKEEMKFAQKNPLLFQTKYKNNKTISVKKFPYLIHFKIIGKEILVKAILHTARNPKEWDR